ncbi:uracil-DNA glycosylase [Alkalihalobacillus alcalophilus ATCC 27647 = CGMCC 1.3604]|uniref:Uracil-DNA glycosylase n=1 Tax=Alkalihalobacillus alcalophilus ATCC 27647 = CGMCC 1.3604 TaxID=1218173 RepID=A0A094WIK3_ALKAL|nr:uracil-DNA glycosylase [Alkalihalobacillus alcalophilus]KGA95723.1 uracil-DNA glycosylase [Alkalihalobacillus alcalophilus ATCC 27647 = CGMCC 1.3604]MED1564039.1 uracil-DNA glycosylase [Alkalihalobacillus alcalophilus]THG90964.1 uracil-DNA glycosylase [Alkalihalobacillus alcalophilus ATCC 27647 = CGMCC 1.3604]
MLVNNRWKSILEEESQKRYFQDLLSFIEKEYEQKTIYPAKENVFRAFDLTDFDDVKVVILGQDPYHGSGQAHGLSFSVQKGVKLPPSLRNIFKELQADMDIQPPEHGLLESWAKQGVLLMNTVLTVEEGQPASHKGRGWEIFTDRIMQQLNERAKPVVFLLWGKQAEAKKSLITNNRHPVFISPHPSPFSANRGFFGSKPFSKINEYLKENGSEPIDWEIQ